MRHVLWLEDSVNSSLEICLKQSGYDYLKFSFGSVSFALIKEIRPDVIIVNPASLTERCLNDLTALKSQFSVPILVILSKYNTADISALINAEIAEISLEESVRFKLEFSIETAIARFKHYQLLKTALDEARAKFEDRKQIDRAKAILIKTRNFNEDEAYHTLRKLAMDRNVTLGEISKNVIAMAELFK